MAEDPGESSVQPLRQVTDWFALSCQPHAKVTPYDPRVRAQDLEQVLPLDGSVGEAVVFKATPRKISEGEARCKRGISASGDGGRQV